MEWTPDEVVGQVINPFYAITVSEDLTIEHAPLVSRETWIEANTKLIDELGARAWLEKLLTVLETGAGG
jgi:hypothetical protein